MPAPATRSAWQAAALDLAGRHDVAAGMLARHGPPRLRPGARSAERFAALASSIAYQQLAGRAAEVIWARVVDAVGSPFTPERVLAAGPEVLRAAGLSNAKVAALTDLAARTHAGEVRLDRIGRMGDRAIIEHLTAVRGIGPWTAQMFLLFELRRLDVWPTGDYGVRAGFARAFGLDRLPSERELAALGVPFEPYRSVLAWWCWREVDANGQFTN
jgi:DNA-3-methyladenine glycosylase II